MCAALNVDQAGTYEHAGSSVKHLLLCEAATDLQIGAVLEQYTALESLSLIGCSFTSDCLARLNHFQHIKRLEISVKEIKILRSVFALTHLRELRLECWLRLEQIQDAKLPCNQFAHLTRLEIETEGGHDEPEDAFNYLSQLHGLKHLRLSTAGPVGFDFKALSNLQYLSLSKFSVSTISALQWVATLQDLKIEGSPADAEIVCLAKLTQLTSLTVKAPDDYEDPICHLSSVIRLCWLANLKELYCEVIIDGIVYSTRRHIGTAADNDMLVSLAGSPVTLVLRVLEY